jgi:peptide/nickel transport system substrate-binding protein/oligopeptide transport system substrate-binding protein
VTVRARRWGALALAAVALVGVAGSCTKKKPAKRPAVVRRGVFTAAVVKPASLDPALARTVDEQLVADQLYDTLAAYDPKTLEPVPSLAASWSVSDDQQHWDFTLRPDARFSDGSPVTATDVKATLDRVARKDTASTVNDLLEPVTGYRAVAVDGSASELAGVVAATPSVLHIDLDQPVSVLPSILANPAFGVLPAATISAGSGAGPTTPTSGPFHLAGGASLDAHELRLLRSAGGGAASPELRFALYESRADAFAAFVAGTADWSEVPPDQVPAAAQRYGKAQFRPYVGELFYAFNLRNAKFADARFREAIVRAVDRDAIGRDVYSGTVRTIDGLIVDGLAGHEPPGAACGDLCRHDVDKAKALVADLTASGATLPEVQLDFEDDKTQRAVATAIQKDLAAVGITASLRPQPLADYQQFAVSGQQELFRLGWIAPYPSADAILTPLFLTGSPNNLSGFSSSDVDAALRAARASGDAGTRVAQWQQAEKLILAQAAVVPIAQFDVQTVVSARVRGLEMTSFGSFDGRRVSVV